MSLPPLFILDHFSEFAALAEEDARHAAKVLRLKPGSPVHLTDGRGKLVEAEIAEVSPKQLLVSHLRLISDQPAPPGIHLCVSLLKNPDRFEWMVEKATELGVSRISPMVCTRTESQRLNLPRLQRIVHSAMKQSRQVWETRIGEAVSFADLLNRAPEEHGFIAYCEELPPDHLIHRGHQGLPARLLIGPEGDFTPEEVQKALDAGFEAVGLGSHRLRTETAAIIALHSLQLANLQKQPE